jgi:hypothetical protein
MFKNTHNRRFCCHFSFIVAMKFNCCVKTTSECLLKQAFIGRFTQHSTKQKSAQSIFAHFRDSPERLWQMCLIVLDTPLSTFLEKWPTHHPQKTQNIITWTTLEEDYVFKRWRVLEPLKGSFTLAMCQNLASLFLTRQPAS